MSAVSESIVREFFELHCFFVRQQRKYVAPSRRDDEEIDFFVINPKFRAGEPSHPFVLAAEDLPKISRALVVVKGWHTEIFSPAVLANAPEIFRFVQPSVFEHASRTFEGEGPLTKILIVPALPAGEEAREQSIALLRGKGVDAVIPFRAMLADLIAHTESNRNYQKSDVLQIIRILKNYEFFKEAQLDLFKSPRRKKRKE